MCEHTHALEVAQPTVSRHLAQLRETGLVRDRREGTWIHYRLHPELPRWVREVIHASGEGLSGRSPFKDDRQALRAMPNRPAHCCP